ncbi:MAG: hypothetical protein Q4A98_06520 [Comamonadaceae bacterium]|nr:hypothetical protein [Comamonadaceae bacterium]
MVHKFREFQIVQTVRALPAEGDGDDGRPVAARDQGQAGTLEDMCAQAARALSASDYSGAWPEAAIAPGAIGTVVDLCGSAETGYGNISAFIEAFARHFGATPGQYLQADATPARHAETGENERRVPAPQP